MINVTFFRPLLPLAALLALLLGLVPAARAGWAEEALTKEANYISDASFSEAATHHADVTPQSAGRGAINDVRIDQSGPDWVQPQESALAAIGLMGAARQLKIAHRDTARYDAVLSRFFETWLFANRQGMDVDSRDADYGGFARRVFYDKMGHWQRDEGYNTGTTGMMVIALWKYGEYLGATGRAGDAARWRRSAWPLAKLSGDYLRRRVHPAYHLVQSSAAAPDLWTADCVYAADALRCLSRWAKATGQKPPDPYAALAPQLIGSIRAMRDNGSLPGFFKYRDSRAGYKPTNGDSLDQLAFLPYEADALPPLNPFARQISDGWTNGAGGIRMTVQTDNPHDWRFWGVHWHHYFTPRPENAYLYPGPGLQLAAMEWKAGTALHDPTLLDRARRRYEWANKTEYANLWLGAGTHLEANIGNGLVDWRDGDHYAHKAEDWQRFVDTSAYFIGMTLRICYGRDTKLVPE